MRSWHWKKTYLILIASLLGLHPIAAKADPIDLQQYLPITTSGNEWTIGIQEGFRAENTHQAHNTEVTSFSWNNPAFNSFLLSWDDHGLNFHGERFEVDAETDENILFENRLVESPVHWAPRYIEVGQKYETQASYDNEALGETYMYDISIEILGFASAIDESQSSPPRTMFENTLKIRIQLNRTVQPLVGESYVTDSYDYDLYLLPELGIVGAYNHNLPAAQNQTVSKSSVYYESGRLHYQVYQWTHFLLPEYITDDFIIEYLDEDPIEEGIDHGRIKKVVSLEDLSYKVFTYIENTPTLEKTDFYNANGQITKSEYANGSYTEYQKYTLHVEDHQIQSSYDIHGNLLAKRLYNSSGEYQGTVQMDDQNRITTLRPVNSNIRIEFESFYPNSHIARFEKDFDIGMLRETREYSVGGYLLKAVRPDGGYTEYSDHVIGTPLIRIHKDYNSARQLIFTQTYRDDGTLQNVQHHITGVVDHFDIQSRLTKSIQLNNDYTEYHYESDEDIFANIQMDYNANGNLLEYRYYDDSGLLIETEHPIEGDINVDSVVDLQDFAILKSHFGESDDTITRQMGDLNNDKQVDLQDFNILKTHFGSASNQEISHSISTPELELLLSKQATLTSINPQANSIPAINETAFPKEK